MITSKIQQLWPGEMKNEKEVVMKNGMKAVQGICNRYKLHHLCYYEAREKFNLPSQFIINANRVASQTLKSIKTNRGSKPVFKELMPLAFDKRTFTFNPENIRLKTIDGRINVPVTIPE